jgi:hypothetical protein
METDISSSGIWSNNIFISSTGIYSATAFPHVAKNALVVDRNLCVWLNRKYKIESPFDLLQDFLL